LSEYSYLENVDPAGFCAHHTAKEFHEMHGDFLNTNIPYFGLSPFLLNVYHASCEKNVTFCSLLWPEQNLMFRVCSLAFDMRDFLMKFW